MSEVVVRMEMPTENTTCELNCYSNFYREWRCIIKDKRCDHNKNGMFPSWCPIICPLPEGHGRLVSEKDVRWAIDDIVLEIAERIGHVPMTKNETMEYVNRLPTIVPAEAESPSPKPTDPVPVRDVYYVMTECDAKAGTVKYEPRERIEL